MSKRYVRMDLEYDTDKNLFDNGKIAFNLQRIISEDIPYVKVIRITDSNKLSTINLPTERKND